MGGFRLDPPQNVWNRSRAARRQDDTSTAEKWNCQPPGERIKTKKRTMHNRLNDKFPESSFPKYWSLDAWFGYFLPENPMKGKNSSQGVFFSGLEYSIQVNLWGNQSFNLFFFDPFTGLNQTAGVLVFFWGAACIVLELVCFLQGWEGLLVFFFHSSSWSKGAIRICHNRIWKLTPTPTHTHTHTHTHTYWLVYLLFPGPREKLHGGFLDGFDLFSEQFSVNFPVEISGKNHWTSV